MVETSPVRMNDEKYQPIMVIGWAMENDIRFAMFISSARFAIRARTNWIALTAISLEKLPLAKPLLSYSRQLRRFPSLRDLVNLA